MSDQYDVPARPDLEEWLLGGVFADPSVLHDIGFLKADDFFRARHADVWRAIGRLKDMGKLVDPMAVDIEMEQAGVRDRLTADELLDLMSKAYTSVNVPEYAQIVRTLGMKRRVVEGMERAMREARRRDSSIAEVLAAVQKVAYEGESFGAAATSTLAAMALRAMDAIQRRAEGAVVGLPTGLRDVDGYLGGLLPGQMVVVAARPGMGKSAFAQAITRHAARLGKRSYVASLEMTGEEWAARMIQAEAGVSLAEIRPGAYLDDHRDQIGAAYDVVRGLDSLIVIDDRPSRTIGDIAASARREKGRAGLDLVVIDYLQLVDAITDVGRDANRQEQVAHVSRRVKAMAKELEIPVVALAQLNRESVRSADKRPGLHDLRESGQIEQDADVVMLLHRPCYYDPAERPGVAVVNVAKNRNGPTALVDLSFVERLTKFGDYDEPAFGMPASTTGGDGAW